jgi:hypothetical protein
VFDLSVDAITLSQICPRELYRYLEGLRDYPNFVERCLDDDDPDLVILSLCKTEAEIVARVCEAHNRRHVFYLTHCSEFKVIPPFQFRSETLHIVASEYCRKKLIQKGVLPNRIVIAGAPGMDSALAFRNKKSGGRFAAIKKRFFGGARNILYTTQGLEQNVKLLELLKRYVRARSKVKLQVRPHPREANSSFKGDAGKGFELKKGNLTENLMSADVLVTLSSLTMLEALILDVPAVSFQSGFFPAETVFSVEGDVLTARNYRELENNLDRILFNQEFREAWISRHKNAFAKYTSSSNDSAAQRFAAVIEAVLANKPGEESVCHASQSGEQKI